MGAFSLAKGLFTLCNLSGHGSFMYMYLKYMPDSDPILIVKSFFLDTV